MGNKSKDELFSGTKGNPQLTLEQNEFENNNKAETCNSEENQESKLSKRDELLNSATTDETKEIINQLYRPGALIGDGGTADALRMEIYSGLLSDNKNHLIKAVERVNQINKILKRNPNHKDKKILISLRDDLIDAINKAKEKK